MNLPDLGDLDLAYETGLHVGDGNLSRYRKHDYRYVLSGNANTEFEFYKETVVPLIEKLYSLTPSLYIYHNSIFARVYSKALVLFKSRELGLPIGPKDQLTRLPSKIVEQGKPHIAQIISGLYDTDGCPKVRKTPTRWYPRISFAQKTKGVVEDVHYLLLDQFGISSTLYRNAYFDRRHGALEVRWFLDVNGFDNLAKFTHFVGSRHPNVQKKLRFLGSLGTLAVGSSPTMPATGSKSEN